jgi:uncharacterized membrane protein
MRRPEESLHRSDSRTAATLISSSSSSGSASAATPMSAASTGKAPRIPRVLERSIRRLVERHDAEARSRSMRDRVADRITQLSGSIRFVWIHVVWFGAWIALNVGLLAVEAFDPFPFGLLTLIVSLEAIFLSTFVLLSQNRMQATADQRAELDLHINLLAERESTLILAKLVRIEQHLGISVPAEEDRLAGELAEPTDAAELLKAIERREKRPT